MAKTLAEMTPDERASMIGMWCEGILGNLVILQYVTTFEAEGKYAIVINPNRRNGIHGSTEETYSIGNLTPRFDLPRAWNPDGTPVEVTE